MTTPPITPPSVAAKPGSGRVWPLMVLGLLGLNVTIVTVTIVAAQRTGAAAAVEPNYYQRAIDWDRTAEERRASTKLGWTAGVEVAAEADSPTSRGVLLSLRDAQGAPIERAVVDVEAFAQARSGQRSHATMADEGGGVYRAAMPLSRPGLWEFRVTARRGGELWTGVLQGVDVAPAKRTR